MLTENRKTIELIYRQVQETEPASEGESLFQVISWKQRDRYSKSPVYDSLENGSSEAIDFFLRCTPDYSLGIECFIDGQNRTNLLHRAITCKQANGFMRSLVNKLNPDYLNQLIVWRDDNGNNALHHACGQEYSIFKFVLNISTSDGYTEQLLQPDFKGQNVLHLVSDNRENFKHFLNCKCIGDSELLGLLNHSDCSGMTPFEKVVYSGDYKTVATLISRAGVTEKDKLVTVDSLMNVLESSGQISNFAFLAPILWDLKLWDQLSQNQRTTVSQKTDGRGRLIMHHVIQNPHYQRHLIEHIDKSDTDLVNVLTAGDNDGLTPLELGLLEGKIDEIDDLLNLVSREVVKMVFERLDKFGNNLFFYAAISPHSTQAWDILIGQYHDYDLYEALTRDTEGNNPLMYVLCANEDPREILTSTSKEIQSWANMKNLLQQKNIYGLSCLNVRTHIEQLAPFSNQKNSHTISKSIALVKLEDSIHFALKRSRHFRKELTTARHINENISELLFFL